jgi:Recombination endonuclease VII
MTLHQARREAARRGQGWKVRRDARRLGGWYIRSPTPVVSRADWDALIKQHRGRCFMCRRRSKLVREHNHRTGRIRFPACSGCNCALGLLARAGVRTYRALMLWGERAGVVAWT